MKGDRKQFDTAKKRLSELEISQINIDSAAQNKRGKENNPATTNHQDVSCVGFNDTGFGNRRMRINAVDPPLEAPQYEGTPHIRVKYFGLF